MEALPQHFAIFCQICLLDSYVYQETAGHLLWCERAKKICTLLWKEKDNTKASEDLNKYAEKTPFFLFLQGKISLGCSWDFFSGISFWNIFLEFLFLQKIILKQFVKQTQGFLHLIHALSNQQQSNFIPWINFFFFFRNSFQNFIPGKL